MPTIKDAKVIELKELDVVEVSFVENPAVDNEVLIRKNEDGNEYANSTARFIHKNMDKGIVYFYALKPFKKSTNFYIDKQNHLVKESEIERAVLQFAKNMSTGKLKGNGVGLEHTEFNNDLGYIILSVYDKTGHHAIGEGIPKEKVIKGGWLVGFQLTDKGKKLVDSGKVKGISIMGKAKFNEVNLQKNNSKDDVKKRKWFDELIQFFKKDFLNIEGESEMTETEIKDIVQKEIKSIKDDISKLTVSLQDISKSITATMEKPKEEPKENKEVKQDNKELDTFKLELDSVKKNLTEILEITKNLQNMKGTSNVVDTKPKQPDEIQKNANGKINGWDLPRQQENK